MAGPANVGKSVPAKYARRRKCPGFLSYFPNAPRAKGAADAKVFDLLATKKTGTFFLQLVKEPMPEEAAPAPGAR